MRKIVLLAVLAGLYPIVATVPADAAVDVNVNVRAGAPAPPPSPVMVIPRPPVPPPPPYVVVRKGNKGRHLGHYKHKEKFKKHKGHN